MTAVEVEARSIFLAAIDRAPGEWPAFLEESCDGNAELRANVEQLLRAHEAMGSIHGGGQRSPVTIDPPAVVERTGTVIGPYKLLEQIGEGGMGTVWMAQQSEPVKRLVAVKLIKAGMDSRQVIARFEAERQALALMDHANIARVLDAGTTAAGRPYFVMDLVRGVPITRYCDEHHLTPRQRLELFIPVCQAIQHAHQKGIIHRDLKPTNVLVALYDGKPVPKVIDFGVAKATGQALTDKTLVTGFGNIVGTLEYMSPEQAEINQLDIDTRSDIYSLGVLLYELLAGSPPFSKKDLEQAGMLEMLRIIREQEPSKPSTKLSSSDALPTLSANRGTEPAKLTRLVKGELDWIVMKALEKDRARRYETANGFAADMQRYLDDEPVQACPPSAGYRFRKFARRNKTRLVMVSVIGLALLLAVGSLGWVVRDRKAGSVRTASEVNQFLQRAESLFADNKLPEAVAEVQKARGVLEAGSGDEELAQRVQQWLTDLDTAAKLEEIRLEAYDVEGYDQEDRAQGYADYAQEFRDYGIDVEALSTDEAVTRVAASQIKLDLVLALSNWAWRLRFDSRTQDPARWQRLLAISQAADPDPEHLRLNGAIEAKDVRTLRELAARADLSRKRTRILASLGNSLRTAGDTEAAVAFLRKAQQQHPGDFMINSNLALCLSALKPPQFEEVITFRRVAVAVRPQSAYAHRVLGSALKDKDRLDDAIVEYRETIRLRPGYVLAHNGLGLALTAQENLDEAVAAYRRAIEIDPKCAFAYNNLGSTLRTQKKLDEAIAAYRRAIEIDPKYADAYNNLGNAQCDQKKLDEAIAAYRRAIEIDPKSVYAHANLGQALLGQNKAEEAITCYRKAIDIDPKCAFAYNHLGSTLRTQKKLDEALACVRKAIELDPKDADAQINLGTILCNDLREYQKAEACFRKAIELDPKSATAQFNLGIALYNKQKLPESIAAFRKAIELDPKSDLKSANAHYCLGNALKDQGKLDDAIACYHKAIELDPKYAAAYGNLGGVLSMQNKLGDAIAACRKAIEIDPKFANAHNNLGNALKDQGKLDDAIACYHKAIELDPKFTYAHNGLGIALKRQGKLPDAIACYRKAIEIDPKYAAAYNNLGIALNEQGKQDEAIAAYRKAILLEPTSAIPYTSLGIALRCQKKLDEAIAAYRKAIEIDPKFAFAYYNLGNALQAQWKWDESIACCRKAIELDPKFAHTYSDLAYALANKGWNLINHPDPKLRDPQRAIELGKEAVEIAPQPCQALQFFGWIQYRAGNWMSSIEALEKSCNLQEGGMGDAGQWIVLALAHARLAAQDDLPDKEREQHKAEARRRFDQAAKQIDSWQVRPGDVTGRSIWDLRAEARELMSVKESK